MKKILKAVTATVLTVSMLLSSAVSASAYACNKEWDDNNLNRQNYVEHDHGTTSYLVEQKDGFMMVQGRSKDGAVLVSYYDKNYKLKKTLTVKEELPMFGAFYTDGKNYYIISGRHNKEKSDKVEVVRVTKYDKNWKRLSRCKINNIGVWVPFDDGTVSVASNDKYIFILTSKQIFFESGYSGNGHQSSLTLVIDKKNMKFVRVREARANDISFSKVDDYVVGAEGASHSFGQAVTMDGDMPVFANQGDVNARGINIAKWGTGIIRSDCVQALKVAYQRKDCENSGCSYQWTGCSIGGLGVSDKYYFVVGGTTKQDGKDGQCDYDGPGHCHIYYDTNNVFVSIVPKEMHGEIEEHRCYLNIDPIKGKVLEKCQYCLEHPKKKAPAKVTMITNYEEGDGNCTTPQLVKIDDNKFMVLWARNDNKFTEISDYNYKRAYWNYHKVCYTLIDGEGNRISKIYNAEGYLSDCDPILTKDGKVVWYTIYNKQVSFNAIDLSTMKLTTTDAA